MVTLVSVHRMFCKVLHLITKFSFMLSVLNRSWFLQLLQEGYFLICWSQNMGHPVSCFGILLVLGSVKLCSSALASQELEPQTCQEPKFSILLIPGYMGYYLILCKQRNVFSCGKVHSRTAQGGTRALLINQEPHLPFCSLLDIWLAPCSPATQISLV